MHSVQYVPNDSTVKCKILCWDLDSSPIFNLLHKDPSGSWPGVGLVVVHDINQESIIESCD